MQQILSERKNEDSKDEDCDSSAQGDGLPVMLCISVIIECHDQIWNIENIVPAAEGKGFHQRCGKHPW